MNMNEVSWKIQNICCLLGTENWAYQQSSSFENLTLWTLCRLVFYWFWCQSVWCSEWKTVQLKVDKLSNIMWWNHFNIMSMFASYLDTRSPMWKNFRSINYFYLNSWQLHCRLFTPRLTRMMRVTSPSGRWWSISALSRREVEIMTGSVEL